MGSRESCSVKSPSDHLDTPEERPSFLARRTFGPPNYFLLAMLVAFLIAFMPRGVRKAVESNTNKAEDWLPPNYSESIDLRWFRDHFIGEQFVLVSWEGCTLGDTEKLQWLVKKLTPSPEVLAKAPPDSDLHHRADWYKHIMTGPGVLEQLVSPPLSLEYGEAIRRIEGALVGPVQRDAQGRSLGDDSRITCMIVFLSELATRDNKTMRKAVESIAHIAETESGIPQQSIRMGGPPVDNITIDIEGERTLIRLAALSGIVGLALSYWCFRSLKVTCIVFAVGVLSAGMSLALVFYFGVVEVMLFGAERPRLGTVDAILMSMPAVVYVLGLSGAIHIVNYYRDARREHGLKGAAERAVRLGWAPCTLAACTTAVGLGSLYISDIMPIKKFGLFTGISVLGTVVILFTILPVFLHRFPPSDALIRRQSGGHDHGHLPNWALGLFSFVIRRHVIVCIFWAIVMSTSAYGFTKIGTSVQLLKLLDPDTKLIHDYAWLEKNLGNLVPMEVVLTMPPERLRAADEHAEENGSQYRMTMVERLDMMRQIQSRIEEFPEISRVLSVATFTPTTATTGIVGADRSADYAKNRSLEENRDLLLDGDYLRMERDPATGAKTGRELWRVSARVAALGVDNNPTGPGIDYGLFVQQLRSAVDPILMAYQQRDMIVAELHAQGKRLDGSQVRILMRAPEPTDEPVPATQESVLRDLLRKSGVQSRRLPGGGILRGVSAFNLAELEALKDDPDTFDRAIESLRAFDALILVSAASDPVAQQLAAKGLPVIDVTRVPEFEGSAATTLELGSAPRPIRAVYTGMVPLVYKTQRQLLFSLEQSIFVATLLIAFIMMFVLRSPLAGLISMIPNVFPIVMIFGGLGWLGIKVDIGIMMSASVALGVAVDDTIHFLTWFRRGVAIGLNRIQAVMLAYDRCATAMLQTTIIGGLGLAVFATSTFTPTQQFGFLMISMLGAALIGDLLLLPAILASPLGRFFGGTAADEAIHEVSMRDAYVHAKEQHVESLKDASGQQVGDSDEPQPESQEGKVSAAEIESPQEATPPQATPQEEGPAKRHQPAAAEGKRPTAPARHDKQDHKQEVEGPHAALHAKLRSLRRDSSDSVSS